jgi:sulfur relay (sulfurtransferase) DsrC/TusE family protein
MFFNSFLDIDKAEELLKSRLSKDTTNEAIKKQLRIIDYIKKNFSTSKGSPSDWALIEKVLSQETNSKESNIINEYIRKNPSVEEELVYYLEHRNIIDTLRDQFLKEEAKVVFKISSKFFNRHIEPGKDQL